MKGLRTKIFKFGKAKIRITDLGNGIMMFIDLGRYKKKDDVDTWTLYESIMEEHKPYAHIWADIQKKQLIGVEIVWDKPDSPKK